MTIQCQIGERIRARREYLAMTQGDLARLVNVARETISNWENGRRGIDAADMPDLARALRVDVSYFYGEGEYVADDVPPELARVYRIQSRIVRALPPGKARQKYIAKLESDTAAYEDLLRILEEAAEQTRPEADTQS